jgi:serine/threonine protein kinase
MLIDKHGTPVYVILAYPTLPSRRGFPTSNVGTAPYMAPELFFVLDTPETNTQASSSPSTTTSSDVYSFALLVLEVRILPGKYCCDHGEFIDFNR